MYAKLFAQMYDGSLCTRGPWEALVTFQQMLVLADQEGTLDMTAEALSRRTTIPIEIIQRGIDSLLQPDPTSRTPDEDGRRIVPLSDGRDWGWRLVNYQRYRQLQRERDRREYHREYWHKRPKKTSNGIDTQPKTQQPQPIHVAPPLNQQAYAEAEAYAEAKAVKDVPLPAVEECASSNDEAPAAATGYKCPDCPYEKLVGFYHQHMPANPLVEVISPQRKRHMQARWRHVCSDEKLDREGGLDWFDDFFRTAGKSKFLTGKAKPTNGRRPFIATIDFLMDAEKFVKIVEGGYA